MFARRPRMDVDMAAHRPDLLDLAEAIDGVTGDDHIADLPNLAPRCWPRSATSSTFMYSSTPGSSPRYRLAEPRQR